MRLRPHTSRIAVIAALLGLAAASVAAALCQQKGTAPGGSQGKAWAALRTQRPTVIGCLRISDSNCSGYPNHPCRGLLVQAFEYRWDGLRPNELKITDLDRHKVILVDRNVGGFIYMLPLDYDMDLLATVWASADSNGGVKVYSLNGNRVEVVFENGSRFDPQFIAANEATPIPLILLDRYIGGIGEIAPQETEIWRWDAAKEKFHLATTVPVGERFEAVAKIEREATKK